MVILIFLVPMWIPVAICIVVAMMWKKWYTNPGYFLAMILIFALVVIPLSLEWAIDQRWLSLSGELYSLYMSFTPKLPFIPLVSFDYETVSWTYNLDPQMIALIFAVTFFFIVLIRIVNQVKRAMFMTTGTVYYISAALVFLGFLDFILRGFTGQGLFDVLYTWLPQGIIFYHVVFNVLPVAAILLLANMGLRKLGLG